MAFTRRYLLYGAIASTVANVGLAYRLSELKRPSRAEAAPPFEFAPPLSVINADGKPVAVTYGRTQNTLLYYFSTTCQWCQRNLENLRSLGGQQGSKYELVAVAPQDSLALTQYAAKNRISFPLYTIQGADAAHYGLRVTPSSILIDHDGKFLAKWDGAYSASLLAEIEKALSIRLSGPVGRV